LPEPTVLGGRTFDYPCLDFSVTILAHQDAFFRFCNETAPGIRETFDTERKGLLPWVHVVEVERSRIFTIAARGALTPELRDKLLLLSTTMLDHPRRGALPATVRAVTTRKMFRVAVFRAIFDHRKSI
jgi:hypothetical protein